jgi:hypothetical protein
MSDRGGPDHFGRLELGVRNRVRAVRHDRGQAVTAEN